MTEQGKNILKTLFIGIFLGISVSRTVISIARSEQNFTRLNIIHDEAANDFPTILDKAITRLPNEMIPHGSDQKLQNEDSGGVQGDKLQHADPVTDEESAKAAMHTQPVMGQEQSSKILTPDQLPVLSPEKNTANMTLEDAAGESRVQDGGLNTDNELMFVPANLTETKASKDILNKANLPQAIGASKDLKSQESVKAAKYTQPVVDQQQSSTSLTPGQLPGISPQKNTTNMIMEGAAGESRVIDNGVNTDDEHKFLPANLTETKASRVILNKANLSPAIDASKVLESHAIVDFEHQEGVAIVTKLHGHHQLMLLEQSLCLLHYAYNNRVNYDIVVFTTMPINETELVTIRQIVAPAKFTVVVDNDGLQNEINNLSPIRRENFLLRCNVTDPNELTWWTQCREGKKGKGRLAYNWQAEFRAWHIWRNPALAPYRYMLWMDTDGFSTKVWEQDPVAIAIRNSLVMFFGNFPMGHARGEEIQPRIKLAFNKTLCNLKLVEEGHFKAKVGGNCLNANVPDIHGFFHITNLDFYRSDAVIHWAKTLIGDCFLCRRFDDQIAVTVPPAMLAPEKAWDMYANGVKLGVFHNFDMDGKRDQKSGGFKKYWPKNAKERFPEAWGKCKIHAGG